MDEWGLMAPGAENMPGMPEASRVESRGAGDGRAKRLDRHAAHRGDAMRIDVELPSDGARPTPSGSRRRPRTRERDLKRPGVLYRRGIGFSFAWLMADDRAREEREEARSSAGED